MLRMRLRRDATRKLIIWAYIGPSLRIIEVFASFLNGEEHFARFVAKLSSLLSEAVVQVHVFPRLFGVIL